MKLNLVILNTNTKFFSPKGGKKTREYEKEEKDDELRNSKGAIYTIIMSI